MHQNWDNHTSRIEVNIYCHLEKNEHINLFSSSDPAVSWGIVCHEAENVHFCSPDTYRVGQK